MGCVTPRMIIQKRYPATSAALVSVLVEEPQDAYETLAIISIEAAEGQSGFNSAIQKMKISAASIGADAIVIQGQQIKNSGAVAMPLYGGGVLMVPVNTWTITAKAIQQINQGGAGRTSITGESGIKPEQLSDTIERIKLEDISVTISPNATKLKNSNFLVGPIWSAVDGGKSELHSSQDNPDITIAIQSGFMKAGYVPVERDVIKDILSEMSFQQTGAVSAHDAVRLGEISGAGIIITTSEAMFGVAINRAKDADIRVAVSMKAISVESGEVVALARYYGRIKKGYITGIAQRLGNELSMVTSSTTIKQ